MKLFKRIVSLALCLLLVSSGSFSILASAAPWGCPKCGGTESHAEDCELGKMAELFAMPFSRQAEPEESSEPTGETSEPTGESSEPTGETSEPTGETSEPTEESSEPTGETSEPTEESSEPTEESTDPSEPVEKTLCEQLMELESTEEMYVLVLEKMESAPDQLMALTAEEIADLRQRITEIDPEGDDTDTQDLLDTLAVLPNGGEKLEGDPIVLANNVHNVTQNKWYDTLSAAVSAANNGDTIEVHNSFTETSTVKIQKDYLKIRAANGKTPTISWTKTDAVAVPGATSYSCIVIYTDVKNATALGGGTTGTLTFDASKASDADNKGSRARVIMHCGAGNLNLNAGIVITGGNPGGGSYEDDKYAGQFPTWSGEVSGETGFGAGIYMYSGTLNMSGGVIKDNYSLWGSSSNHNYVGGGGGVYLHSGTMNMTGGTITHNAAGSGGGAGILVGHGATLNVSDGTISENVSNFASGGGIGVRTQSEVVISGGQILNNHVEGHGGGVFARGDSIPLKITGGRIEGNSAVSYGGGVLFWTVGDDLNKNTVIIGGDVQIENNTASRGGGVSVGREVKDGVPIGTKAKLIIQGNPIINGNTATTYGGGIDMQSDEFAKDVNTVEVSGGTISGNKAVDGGGIYVPGGTVTMTAGTFNGNTASGRGAGIFTGGGTMTLSGASFTKNIANEDGGGAFVQGGNVIMNSGAFTENAASNGGALYINNGNFTMTGGSVSANKATGTNTNGNGGGAYVAGGNVTIEHGTLNSNEAVKGGAVYMAATTATLIMESGTMNENKVSDDGGAIYANGGTIKIGLEACKAETGNALTTCTHHTAKGTGRHHPEISGNTAEDTGGGIALTDGVVHFYCGEAKINEALYKGVGKNVFMNGGEFHLYDGADIGVPRDPDLVIVGGKLHNECATKDYVNLYYYYQNTDTETKMVGLAEYEEIMNLPDGEYFWDAPNGYVFLGWTAKGAASGEADAEVRNKEQYVNSGEPVEILDHLSTKTDQTAKNTNRMFDGTNDKTLHLYALWAPEVSDITYIDGMTGNTINHAPNTYTFSRESNILNIQPVKKSGYDLVGWYIYQNADQNANWNDTQVDYEDLKYEPNYTGTDYSTQKVYLKLDSRNGVLNLEAGNTNFGNITLIADFVPAFTDLKINKKGSSELDANQIFQFHIEGTPKDTSLAKVDMIVTIQGNGFVQLKDLPVGEYTVTELIDWSWRYKIDDPDQDITLSDSDKDYEMTFTNTREEDKWLSGDCFAENQWSDSGITANKSN